MYCTFKGVRFEIEWWDGQAFPLFAYDTETPLIVEGEVPEFVIGSVYAGGEVAYLLKRQDVARFFEVNARSIMWLHNAPFDLAVTQKKLTGDDHLFKTKSILTHMVEGQKVFDTGIIYQLQEIAITGACPQRWGLDKLVLEFCHEKVDKKITVVEGEFELSNEDKVDNVRTSYGKYLDGDIVHYDKMTLKHLTYSAKDAVVTFALARELMKRMNDIDPYNRLLSHDIQLKAAIVLNRMNRTPVHVDQVRAKELYMVTTAKMDKLIIAMSDYGYNELNKTGKKKRYSYVISVIEKERGVTIPFEGKSDAEKKKAKVMMTKDQRRKAEAVEKKARKVAIAARNQGDMFAPISEVVETRTKSQREDDLSEIADHPFVVAFVEFQHLKKLVTTFVKPSMNKGKLYPKWTTLVATGRTACSKPNVQNLPRTGGFRECIIPAKGNVFVGADYSFVELVTFAQVMYWQQGSSILKDVINAGVDPHRRAGKLVLELEDDSDVTKSQRQEMKGVGFGIMGGMNEKTMAATMTASYIPTTVERAGFLRDKYLGVFTDVAKWLDTTETTCVMPTGRVRGLCTFTTAHNSPPQGLAADGLKLSLWELYKQQVTIPLEVHDEIIVECRREDVNKTSEVLTTAMHTGMVMVVPDVKIGVEAVAFERWFKGAEDAYDVHGKFDENGNMRVVTEEMMKHED